MCPSEVCEVCKTFLYTNIIGIVYLKTRTVTYRDKMHELEFKQGAEFFFVTFQIEIGGEGSTVTSLHTESGLLVTGSSDGMVSLFYLPTGIIGF